ncbi:MAG TPA: twin-arginine translocase TatA/TatE family subunit [Thermoanaerobaculia bacterium]
MFGPLGTMEILFILVLALLVFGPRRLPEVGRTIGKALGEFRRATTDLKRSVNAELALEEERPLPRRPPAPRGLEGAEAGAAAPAVRPAAGSHPRSPAAPVLDPAAVESEPGVSERERVEASPWLAEPSAAAAVGRGEEPAGEPADEPAEPVPPPAARSGSGAE